MIIVFFDYEELKVKDTKQNAQDKCSHTSDNILTETNSLSLQRVFDVEHSNLVPRVFVSLDQQSKNERLWEQPF